MSQKNVEVVRAVIAAWNRRDLEAALSSVHPEVEYVNAPSAVEAGTRHGHAGLSLVFRKQWTGLGPAARQEIENAQARGNEVVVALRLSRQMPGSSSLIDNHVATRWTFRDGKVVRFEVLGAGSEFKSALEAAGLPE